MLPAQRDIGMLVDRRPNGYPRSDYVLDDVEKVDLAPNRRPMIVVLAAGSTPNGKGANCVRRHRESWREAKRQGHPTTPARSRSSRDELRNPSSDQRRRSRQLSQCKSKIDRKVVWPKNVHVGPALKDDILNQGPEEHRQSIELTIAANGDR